MPSDYAFVGLLVGFIGVYFVTAFVTTTSLIVSNTTVYPETDPGNGTNVSTRGTRAFDQATLEMLRRAARDAPRGQVARLLHQEFHTGSSAVADWDVQRVLSAFSRGSHANPRRDPSKWDVFVHIRGEFNVMSYNPAMDSDEAGDVAETSSLSPEVPLVFVREGCWHSIAALSDKGAVEFEFKPGLYSEVGRDEVVPSRMVSTGLEPAGGINASGLDREHSRLQPYSRSRLLAMLGSGPGRERLVASGPSGRGAAQPIVTLLAVRPWPAAPAMPERALGDWTTYLWLAGGPVRVGSSQLFLGPGAPVLEVSGRARANVISHGLTAASGTGGVVLELTASSAPGP